VVIDDCGAGHRFVHHAAKRSRAASAPGTAAETSVELTRAPRHLFTGKCRAHLLVTEHVAGTDDHGWCGDPEGVGPICNRSLKQPDRRGNRFARIYSYSKLSRLGGAPTIGPRRPCPKRAQSRRRRRVREGTTIPLDDLPTKTSVFAPPMTRITDLSLRAG
jgi:hypothetical protein